MNQRNLFKCYFEYYLNSKEIMHQRNYLNATLNII